MRLATLLTILLATSAAAREPYPHLQADRPFTVSKGGFVVGGLAGIEMWYPLGEEAFVRPASAQLLGDLVFKAGLFERVELTLPLLITVSLGDRTATEVPEFALFGGIHRIRYPSFSLMPTAGASIRKKLPAATIRGDVEARGTTPLRVGTLGGFWRTSFTINHGLTERLSLGIGLSAEFGLVGPGFTLPGQPRTDRFAGRVYVGGTEDVPLLRWAASDYVDFDLFGQISPGARSIEFRAAVGMRVLLNLQREPSPPPAVKNPFFPSTEGVEAE